MKHKLLKHGIIAATTCALLLQPVLPGLASNSHSVAFAAATISSKIVKLNANNHLYIRDAQVLMQDQSLVLAFTVTLTNNGTRELSILDYWLRVRGKSGKVFSTSLTEADKNKKSVAPKSSVNLTYYAKLDNQTKLTDLNFDVIEWDFDAPNYERRLGTIKYPANASGKVAVFKPSVMLLNNTKVKGAVKQSIVTEDRNGLYLTISYLLENVGFSSTSLSNLGFAIQTDGYSVYDVNAASMAQLTIQPKERKIVTIQAKLPKVLKGKQVSLVPFTIDEANKIKLPAGLFAVPALKPALPTDTGKTRTVYIDGEQVRTTAGSALINENDGSSELTMDFNFENIGTSAIQLPDLEFALQTKDNILYPLSYAKEENRALLPKIKKTLNLSGSIPSSRLKDAQLVVRTAEVEGKEGYVIGAYKIQAAAQQGNMGSVYTYKDHYKVQLTSIQRTPVADSDVLAAELQITNTSNLAKSIPNLNGYFLINGVKVDRESISIGIDQMINITSGGTYNMVVYSKIPYTTAIDNITFVLTEKEPEKADQRLFQFSSQQISHIPAYSLVNGYNVSSIGNRAQVKVLKTNIFEGSGGNYFYAEFEVNNREPRASQLANIGGYLLDQNGQQVPIQVSEVKEKVMPGGKVLLSAWGSISRSFDIQNYQLIFGQSIAKTAGSTPEGNTNVESVLVKPVLYIAKNDSVSINTELKDIQFSANTLSLRNIQAVLNVTGLYNVEGVKLTMDYDLSVDESYDYIAGDHKIRFEFVNQDDAKVTYSKEYALFKSAENNESSLLKGTNIPLEVIFNDPDVQSKVRDYKTYKLHVYDVYGDAKLLIASKELRWFTRE
ncbi:hypothetical protein [Paenibacillus abyssi]|uniref:Uncharacterized protein n=1 Tax=Paenibacillus abyssi TaxID=1340531 RepID=A0A917CKE5_9BACL|nr:hypothetical protein [Paenibacillus abyssi]GGF91630.1 hypothetical protein GCM10010916_06170 [Paenibacillus abyssi]